MHPCFEPACTMTFVHDDELEPVSGRVPFFLAGDETIVAEHFLVEASRHNPTMTYHYAVGLQLEMGGAPFIFVERGDPGLLATVHGKTLLFLGDRYFLDDLRFQEHKPFPWATSRLYEPARLLEQTGPSLYVWSDAPLTFGVLLYAEHDFSVELTLDVAQHRAYVASRRFATSVHLE